MKLKLFLNYIDTALSFIETEQITDKFIYKMIEISALIFISYNIEEPSFGSTLSSENPYN